MACGRGWAARRDDSREDRAAGVVRPVKGHGVPTRGRRRARVLGAPVLVEDAAQRGGAARPAPRGGEVVLETPPRPLDERRRASARRGARARGTPDARRKSGPLGHRRGSEQRLDPRPRRRRPRPSSLGLAAAGLDPRSSWRGNRAAGRRPAGWPRPPGLPGRPARPMRARAEVVVLIGARPVATCRIRTLVATAMACSPLYVASSAIVRTAAHPLQLGGGALFAA